MALSKRSDKKKWQHDNNKRGKDETEGKISRPFDDSVTWAKADGIMVAAGTHPSRRAVLG